MFEVVFDYDEGHVIEDDPDGDGEIFVTTDTEPRVITSYSIHYTKLYEELNWAFSVSHQQSEYHCGGANAG